MKNRTPTKVLEMRGAFRRHPERRKQREHEPQDLPPLGDCPAHLGEFACAAWNDIKKRAPWLRQPDELVLERTACLLAAIREGRGNAASERCLQTYFRMLGLPATERSKVVMPAKRERNRFADLDQ